MTPRNQPCPCGSTKKFKKCCWNPVQLTPRQIPPVLVEQDQPPLDATAIPPTHTYRRGPRSALMLLSLAAALGAMPEPPRRR